MARYMHSAHIRHLSTSAAVFFCHLITAACLLSLPHVLRRSRWGCKSTAVWDEQEAWHILQDSISFWKWLGEWKVMRQDTFLFIVLWQTKKEVCGINCLVRPGFVWNGYCLGKNKKSSSNMILSSLTTEGHTVQYSTAQKKGPHSKIAFSYLKLRYQHTMWCPVHVWKWLPFINYWNIN